MRNLTIRPNRGASAVEFALALPFVVLLIVGSTDFAMWVITHQAVSRAVQDAARHASYITIPDGSNDGGPIEEAARDAATTAIDAWGIDSATATIAAVWQADDAGMMWLNVSAEVPFESMMGSVSPMGRPVKRTFMVLTQEQINN